MNISYCYEQCQVGKAAAEKFLKENNSVIDAATDFGFFTDKCYKTCQYKEKHQENKEHPA